MNIFKSLLSIAIIAGLTACVTPMQPAEQDVCDLEQQLTSCHYFGQKTPYNRKVSAVTSNHTTFPTAPIFGNKSMVVDTQQALSLSVGDKISVKILNGDEFSKDVEVDADGNIYLPYLPPILVTGLTLNQLNNQIRNILIDENLMLAHAVRISILPISWAPIEITTSGAVFEPGQHMINKKLPIELKDDGSNFAGDQAIQRNVAAAVKSSGGVRPDADISAIKVIRNGQVFNMDLRGMLTGEKVPNMTLMAGDHVHVPSTHSFNDQLARPSQLTTPGIRVFMSNLTQPASSNSQSAVDREATRFPYGTRLLNGAIAANCVGGAQTTNASRYVILVTKNPLSNQIDIVERSIDGLIQTAWNNESNPVLLPGDGLACYDSRVTNIREIARTVTELVVPTTLIGWL
ncbi:polysaccharide biosynthesis/export family protein [Shewanella sp. 10N.286.51.B2]|uniref:polysaccharide biosynthesis/export family protein n=1 Tax=Shewanella sp. 10N.286.51.B2 TaxID=3229707 RepID=UPI00354D5C44